MISMYSWEKDEKNIPVTTRMSPWVRSIAANNLATVAKRIVGSSSSGGVFTDGTADEANVELRSFGGASDEDAMMRGMQIGGEAGGCEEEK